jgi:hypothetical protein
MRVVATLLAAATLGTACAVPAGTALVVECRAPETGARNGPALVGMPYGQQHSPIPLDSVQFDSSATASRVAVQSLHAQRTATDTVEVGARLVHCGDTPGAVRIRTNFLREDRAPAEPTSAWRTVLLQPRAIAHYQEFSTSRAASRYVIEIAAP